MYSALRKRMGNEKPTGVVGPYAWVVNFFDAQVMSDVTRHAVENTHFLFDAKRLHPLDSYRSYWRPAHQEFCYMKPLGTV